MYNYYYLLFIYNRPPVIRVSDKVMIPQDEHPDINFVGLLIGPRGNTLKCKSTLLSSYLFVLLIFTFYLIIIITL